MSVSPEQKRRAIIQIALFTAARESAENGVVHADGVPHPTWDELGPVARAEYVKESTSTVEAMCRLGWGPVS